MAFITKRVQAAIQAFRNPSALKYYGGNGWNDLLYGGGSGLTSANRDITFTEQGAATAFDIIVEVQRGVMFIADSIAMLPAGIYDSRTDEPLVMLDTRTLDINTPGATFIAAMRTYERRWMHNFIESIVFSDWLYGETFVRRLSNLAGGVTGVRWLNPIYTEPFIQQGRIQYYRYQAFEGNADSQKPILPEEMAFRIHHRSSREDLRGQSPVLSALNSMNIERNAERGIMAYFRNGMVLGGVMMPEGENAHLIKEEIDRIKTDLRQHHSGVDQSHRWLIPPIRMTFQDFQQPDLEKNYAVVSAASKKIMMALGVPPELAGNPDSVSYDNADKIMVNWLKVNGKAYASKLASYINTSLLAYFEPGYPCYFAFDFSQIDRQDAALTQSDFTAGIIPINVAQAERGYEVDKRLTDIYNFAGKPMYVDAIVREAKGVEETPGKIVYNENGVAIPQGDVFQYHIDSGAIDINEVRAGRGLPPKAAGAAKDDHLTQLQAQFNTMAAGVAAQIPPAIAAQMVGLSLPPGTFQPVYQPGTVTMPGQPAMPQLPAPEPQKGVASLCVLLSFANNPDLIDLQKRLKAMYPDPGIKWNDPAEFHATLLYCPAVDDEQIEALAGSLDMTPDGLSLKVGSLACFDNVGEHALHFRISRNSALMDMQSALYDTCESIGLQTSGYSRPEAFTPHITMGYLPDKVGRITFHGKVQVSPVDIVCSVERGGEYETVWSAVEPEEQPDDTPPDDAAKSVTITHDDHTHNLPIVTRDYSPAAALKELKAWHSFTTRGKSHRPFEFTMLRGDPADFITERLAAGDSPTVIYGALVKRFDGSRLKALETAAGEVFALLFNDVEPESVKSISDLESDFASRFNSMVRDFRQGKPRDEGKAAGILRFLNQNYIRSGYIQGMEDGGVTDEPDDDDNAKIRELVSSANSFVDSFISTLYGDGISDAQAAGKASQWYRGAISPAYSAGVVSANGNLMAEFGGEDGTEICPTCQRLKGQRHRYKDWVKRNLDVPKIGQATECKGWQCAHKLIPVTGKAVGGW